MTTNIDVVAIILMEMFGAISFLVSFVFIKHFQRVCGKMEALQDALRKATTPSERGEEGPCYSYKWVINKTMKPKRIITPSAFQPLFVMALTGVIVVTVLIVFYSAGYSLLLALVGVAVLLETSAFEAYDYSKAIQKAPLDQLTREDLDYMEIAVEALKIGAMRFIVVGTTFAIAGPFVPLIFDTLIYALVLYVSIVFHVAETAQNISQLLAIVITVILSGTLLYLPQLVGRTILAKIKVAIRKIRKHKKE